MKPVALISTLSVCWLGACASSIDVRSVGTGSGALAFELEGKSLVALAAQAARMCPGGHEVLKQWQRLQRPEPDAGLPERWWVKANQWAGIVDADEARLMVQCTNPNSAQAMAH